MHAEAKFTGPMIARRRAQAKGEPRAERGQEKVHLEHAMLVEETIGGVSAPKEEAKQDMAKPVRAGQETGKGLNAVEQALDSGDDVTGVSVHYVNEELDGGEIILQQEVPILPNDNIDSLTKAIQRIEYGILPAAIEHVKEKLQQQNN